MSDTPRPEIIADASAYVARVIEGVAAVWGVGSGHQFGDPENPVVIRAFPDLPKEPFTHVSEMPSAPRLVHHSRNETELNWAVPMTLWVDAADQGEARRKLGPFYGRYLAHFAKNVSLAGTANNALITAFGLDQLDETWFGLRMTLTAIERLDLDNQPGATVVDPAP